MQKSRLQKKLAASQAAANKNGNTLKNTATNRRCIIDTNFYNDSK